MLLIIESAVTYIMNNPLSHDRQYSIKCKNNIHEKKILYIDQLFTVMTSQVTYKMIRALR